ncbi:MAG: hypothetical protein MMC33_001345 [Icmadophila ericetorum]|nr:hypothetical protein [Icmadophila ericetorum]
MATITASRSAPGGVQSSTQANTSYSHPFTCISCQVAFRSSELQRGHMRSDWHRYNLKRKVASLPPLSSEIFAEKVLSAQANSSAAAARAAFEKSCTTCQKTYYSENAYRNHIGSHKHRLREAEQRREVATDDGTSVVSSTISLGEPVRMIPRGENDLEAEAEFSKVVNEMKKSQLEDGASLPHRPSRPHNSANEDRPSQDPLQNATETPSISTPATPKPNEKPSIARCLFCNYDSPSLKLNVLHMTKFHGLFIPEQTYLVDLEGLIKFLNQRIMENHICIFCHKFKSSTSGIQTHMRDKGHCMIAFDEEEDMIEVGQFYDFRSTYSDEEDEKDTELFDAKGTPTGGNSKLGSKRSTTIEPLGGNPKPDEEKAEEEEGWETDSSASSLDSATLHALPIDHDHAFERLPLHRHHSHNDPRPHKTIDGFHSHAHNHHAVFHSDYELHLPSGRTLGHRSLARYYRQNLHNYPTAEERIERRLLAESAVKGEPQASSGRQQVVTRANGGTGMLGVADAKKREVQAVEKRERKRAQRSEKHYQWGVEKRGNFQKHFRDPLLQ